MAFEPGHKLAKGRPAGSLNKRTVAFWMAVEESGFDAAKAIIEIHREAKKIYDNYGVIYDAICEASEARARESGYQNVPPEDKSDKYLKIALDAAKEIAAYCYPKPKYPTKEPARPLDGMTPEQKLEAMKQAVAMLEAELKNGPR